ncbi:MAG: Xaa-Pro peptidase family protein, partial [Gemmatimonadaceae bacterium]
MADTRKARLSSLIDRIISGNLDGLLVSSLANIRYLTGFSGSSALCFVSARDVILITDFRYQTQANEESSDIATVRIEPASLWTGLWAVLPTTGADSIGFESSHLLHRDFQRLLEQSERWRWRPTTDLVESLRAQKDAGEIESIVKAGHIAMAALSNVLDQIRPGLTELSICGVLEGALREAGSEAHPFPPIVASGPRSALPHARASARAIAPGDFLLLDFGATAGGYCSDVTRTVVVGQADERQREVYAAVEEANRAARGAIRAGMRGQEGDALARSVLEAKGLGEAFGHG